MKSHYKFRESDTVLCRLYIIRKYSKKYESIFEQKNPEITKKIKRIETE
jgi:hypothetical protein